MQHEMFTMASWFPRCHADAQLVLLLLTFLVSRPLLVAPNTTVFEVTEPSTPAPQPTTPDRLATSLAVNQSMTTPQPTTAERLATSLTVNQSTTTPQSATVVRLATSLAVNQSMTTPQPRTAERLATTLAVNQSTTTPQSATAERLAMSLAMNQSTTTPQPTTAERLATSLTVNQSTTTPQSATAERLATSLAVTQSTTTLKATTVHDSTPCRRCLIAMVALAIVAGVFMITTIVLCSKILNLPRVPHQRIAKISARSSPAGSSVQALWIEPASSMRERSEIWYGGSAKRKENGLGQHDRETSDDTDPWIQTPVPKARTSRGARQNSLSAAGTDRHLLAPPVITLNQISDFWQREGRSDNSSFKAVPSSRGTVSEAGVDSNSTEEHGSEFFQAGGSVVEPADPRYTIISVDGSGSSQEEEEEIPVVQPKVTQEQITAFLNRGRVPESRFRNGEVTLL